MGLQEKIIAHFEGKVVRKDLSKSVKGNAVVPTYVLEYLLGQHCASFDEDIINGGLVKVKDIIDRAKGIFFFVTQPIQTLVKFAVGTITL